MSRRNVGVVVGALAALVVVLGVVLGSGPGGSPTGSPGPGESGAAVDIDAAACALDPTVPAASPVDPSPSRAAFDDAGTILLTEQPGIDPDEGSGRLRLCVDGREPIELTLGCRWSADRSAVDRLAGFVGHEARDQAFVALTVSDGQIGYVAIELTAAADATGQYRSVGPAKIGLDAEPTGVAGAVAFAEMPFVRSEGVAAPLPNQPQSIGGTLRWACGPPPKPVPGVAAGHLTVRLDLPVGQQAEADATCRWRAGAAGPMVIGVDMTAIPVGGGPTWALGIDELGEPPLATTPGVRISLTTPDGGDSYVAQDYATDVIVAGILPGSRQGRLRFQGLLLAPDTGVPTFDGTEATRTLSGIVSWSCDPPLGGPQPVPGGAKPIVRPPTRPGTVTLDLDGVLDQPLVIPVTCTFHNDLADGGRIVFDVVEGQFTVGDEAVRLLVSDGSLVLFRMAPDGRILGEYTADGNGPRIGGVDEVPPTQKLKLVFRPTDPNYVPFGGDAGRRLIAASVVIDCRDPSAPPSG